MSPEELALFHTLLDKYLIWQSSRCQEKEREERLPHEITTRECQAMCNFFQEGISLETLAAHFRCSTAFVSEQVAHRPWLRSRTSTRNVASQSWWESDHRDPLELVKIFYPQYLPEHIAPELYANEKTAVMTYQEYLDTVDWPEYYHTYGDKAADVVMQQARDIAQKSGIRLSFDGYE